MPFVGFSQDKNLIYNLKSPEFSETSTELKGQWMFYWNKSALDVSKNNLPFTLVKVPGSWDKEVYGPTGFGTYRYKFVHGLKIGEVLGVKFHSVSSAYNLYVNGEKLGSVGTFSQNTELAKPDYFPRAYYFSIKSDTVDILIEVSNYDYRQGGIWITPLIGKAAVIHQKSYNNLIGYSALIGALIVMGLYFLSFYYSKTSEKVNLLFSMASFASAIRIASTGEIIFRQIDFPMNWDTLVKFELISLCMMMLFGVMYIQSLSKNDVNTKVANVISTVNIVFALLFLFLPIYNASLLVPPYLVLAALQLGYLLNLVIKVLINKRKFSALVGGAYLIVLVLGLNDILLSQEFINSVFLAPLGVFLFCFIQAYVLTRKFSLAFLEVEHLSDKLIEINHNQEDIIKERTGKLNHQAQELKKLNGVKDRIFSIIAHDLRAPIKSLGSVLSFADDDDVTLDDLRKYLRGIRKNVDSLNLTLENLLVWSTNQVNGVQSTAELIDIRSIVNQKIELYIFQAKEKDIKLSSQIKERALVYIDSNHLKLILRNLISNAIKFTPNGGLINLSAQYLGNQMIEICISDSGVGMPANIIKKVLEEGEIYTSYGTKNEKGTGLGLMLCKEYVEFNGGFIRIECDSENGTKVLFTLRTQPN